MQATKKPHNYHKTVVWQKDDRIRKSPLKFYGYYYSKISEDCQASIFTKLRWLSVVFLCCFMAHDSRKLRKAFCLQYTGIFVQKLYRMVYLFSGCLRVDRADPQNGPAFQRWSAKRNTKRHSLLSKIRRRLCLYIIKRIQFTVSITSVSVATVGVVHNSESWLLFKIYLFYYTRDRGVCQ